MLVASRTHYIIDLITGAIFAHWAFIVGEKLSYFFDVKLMGLNAIKRKLAYWESCECCGWANFSLKNTISKKEFNFY